MDFRFYEIWRQPEYIERLVTGIGWSLILTIAGATAGFIFAAFLAVARRSNQPLLYIPAATFVEIIRNTPLIVQLFFVVFGLPMLLDYRWPFPLSALLALCLNFSAYYSEIIRSGLDSVEAGQTEAAIALSLNKRQQFFKIVFPQAMASVYPALVSQFVFLFLTTGIISEVGIEEITWAGRFIADRTFRDFEVYLLLTVLYLLIAVGFRTLFFYSGRMLFPWSHRA